MTPVEAPPPPTWIEVGSNDPDLSPFLVLDQGRYHRTWRRDTGGGTWHWCNGRYETYDTVKGWL